MLNRDNPEKGHHCQKSPKWAIEGWPRFQVGHVLWLMSSLHHRVRGLRECLRSETTVVISCSPVFQAQGFISVVSIPPCKCIMSYGFHLIIVCWIMRSHIRTQPRRIWMGAITSSFMSLGCSSGMWMRSFYCEWPSCLIWTQMSLKTHV